MSRANVRLVVPPLLGFVFVAVLVTWQVRSLSEPRSDSYDPSTTVVGEAADSDEAAHHVADVPGVARAADRAVTETAVAAQAGDLLLTAVATKPARAVASVEGLDLEWQEVHTQCAGRDTTEVSVWAAVATVDVAGDVVVELAAGTADIAVLTTRYTGVDARTPIGAAVGANVHEDPLVCEGGADGSSFGVALTPTSPSSRTVVVTGARQFDVTAAPPLVDRASVVTGTDGTSAGLSIADDVSDERNLFDEPSLAPRLLSGALAGETDWAVVAIELLGADHSPQAPTMVLSADRIDFGSAPPSSDGGTPMETATVTVGNDGVADLVIDSITVDGPDAERFRVVGPASFVLATGATRELTIEFRPSAGANASAAVTIVGNDPVATGRIELAGRGGPLPQGIWTSAAELADLPTSGPAWDQLLATADGDLGEADLSDFVSRRDVRTLAVALVYARTGDAAYRDKARLAIADVIGTEDGTTTAVQPCRNLAAYVFAADLIGLSDADPELDATFRTWIDEIRFVEWPDGTLVEEDEQRANNHGRMCGMSRAAIARYLGDDEELAATAESFARFLGDTSSGDFLWRHDLSWQADPDEPVGINPVGAERDGFSIDGALPEEMRRGGPFRIPPVPTEYPWEALQAVVVEAVVLDRAGYDVFDWSDRAILRAVEFLARLDESFPGDGWWATGDDTWVPWVINDVYGTSFPTEPAKIGKSMSWTDWTHAPG